MINKKTTFYLNSFLKHDFKASISVFFVALPLCLGIAIASSAPVSAGLIAGVVGGIIVTLLSKSELSVSGPAAGLAAIYAASIIQLGSFQNMALALVLAGLFQFLLGIFRLGGFTHFIPNAVIKGMLAAIGILLITKQIPLLIGYNIPNFWSNEMFNILTFDHGLNHLQNLYHASSIGVIGTSLLSYLTYILWNKYVAKSVSYIPTSFIVVSVGVMCTLTIPLLFPQFALKPDHFIQISDHVFNAIQFPDFTILWSRTASTVMIWKTAVVICLIASLETLLSIAAIDRLDPYNRITPQNRELLAQGIGNFASGILGGLPVTAVIVRSSANVENGARSKISSLFHGIWLLLAILFAVPLINKIPFCVLAIILVRTGYSLAKPSMFRDVYSQGREQFLPFIVTIIAILLTDLLIGVLIGIVYAIYFLFKHTYRAGFQWKESQSGHHHRYTLTLDQNVSFLNKRRLSELLDKIPDYSEVEINGINSQYIDQDILEILQDFKSKAHRKHIQLVSVGIPEVKTIELH